MASRLAEAIVDALMERLSLELDTLDQDEWDERREELLIVTEKILTVDRQGR